MLRIYFHQEHAMNLKKHIEKQAIEQSIKDFNSLHANEGAIKDEAAIKKQAYQQARNFYEREHIASLLPNSGLNTQEKVENFYAQLYAETYRYGNTLHPQNLQEEMHQAIDPLRTRPATEE
jgi:hypothetical protein